jgi:hypothetical protein
LTTTTRRRYAASLAAAAGALALATGGAVAGTLTLSGAVSDAGNFTISDLQALGVADGTTTVGTFTGVSLWSLLGGNAGGTSSDVIPGAGKNAILRDYVMATGADGRQSLISLGEIDPAFGGTGAANTQPIIAFSNNGSALTTPMLIVPRDPTGARGITSLTNLSVVGVTPPPAGKGGITTSFTVSGGVAAPTSYDLAKLQSLPAVQDNNISFFAGPTKHTDSYTGASFWTVLQDAKPTGSDCSYVLTTGSDGYQVLLALAELDPALGAPSDLLAYADTNVASPDFTVPGGGPDGVARTLFPNENKGGRLVSNLADIDVETVPEPATALLLLAGLAALWRQRMAAVPASAGLMVSRARSF